MLANILMAEEASPAPRITCTRSLSMDEGRYATYNMVALIRRHRDQGWPC